MSSRAKKRAKREKRKKKIALEVQTKVISRLLGKKRIDRVEQATMMLSGATRSVLGEQHQLVSKVLDMREVLLILAKQATGKQLSTEDYECLDDFLKPEIVPTPPEEKLADVEAAPVTEQAIAEGAAKAAEEEIPF